VQDLDAYVAGKSGFIGNVMLQIEKVEKDSKKHRVD